MRLSKATERLKPYVPGPKLSDICAEYGLDDVTLLAANEYWEGPFPEVVSALERALPGLNRYPDQDCAELRGLLAAALDLSGDRLMFGTGSCELLKLLGAAFVDPGDHVVFPEPSFVVYRLVALERQAEFSAVGLRQSAVDLEEMVRAVGPHTRLVIVCNPNNPTGTYHEPDAIRRFVRSLPADLPIVLDEAYGEFVTNAAHEDLAPLVEEHPNLVILRTFSKIYGLAGLRVGYGIAHPDIIAVVDMLRQPYNVTSLAQVAAAEAMRHPQRVAERREYIAVERERLYRAFDRLRIAYVPSEANFILTSVQGLAVPGEEVPRALLQKGFMTRSGYFFGCPGWIRVTVGSRAENDALIDTLASITGRSAGS